MPWEQPLQQILQSVEGPVAKIIAVIIIIVTGLTLAFGDTSGGFRRLIQIVFGLSIAFAASASSCRSSPSAAGRWSDGAPASPSPDSHAPVHRALTEPILLGGAPRAVAIAQRHAGGGARPRPAALDRRSRALGDRPCRRGLGREARSAVRRRGAPASALSPAISGV